MCVCLALNAAFIVLPVLRHMAVEFPVRFSFTMNRGRIVQHNPQMKNHIIHANTNWHIKRYNAKNTHKQIKKKLLFWKLWRVWYKGSVCRSRLIMRVWDALYKVTQTLNTGSLGLPGSHTQHTLHRDEAGPGHVHAMWSSGMVCHEFLEAHPPIQPGWGA